MTPEAKAGPWCQIRKASLPISHQTPAASCRLFPTPLRGGQGPVFLSIPPQKNDDRYWITEFPQARGRHCKSPDEVLTGSEQPALGESASWLRRKGSGRALRPEGEGHAKCLPGKFRGGSGRVFLENPREFRVHIGKASEEGRSVNTQHPFGRVLHHEPVFLLGETPSPFPLVPRAKASGCARVAIFLRLLCHLQEDASHASSSHTFLGLGPAFGKPLPDVGDPRGEVGKEGHYLIVSRTSSS